MARAAAMIGLASLVACVAPAEDSETSDAALSSLNAGNASTAAAFATRIAEGDPTALARVEDVETVDSGARGVGTWSIYVLAPATDREGVTDFEAPVSTELVVVGDGDPSMLLYFDTSAGTYATVAPEGDDADALVRQLTKDLATVEPHAGITTRNLEPQCCTGAATRWATKLVTGALELLVHDAPAQVASRIPARSASRVATSQSFARTRLARTLAARPRVVQTAKAHAAWEARVHAGPYAGMTPAQRSRLTELVQGDTFLGFSEMRADALVAKHQGGALVLDSHGRFGAEVELPAGVERIFFIERSASAARPNEAGVLANAVDGATRFVTGAETHTPIDPMRTYRVKQWAAVEANLAAPTPLRQAEGNLVVVGHSWGLAFETVLKAVDHVYCAAPSKNPELTKELFYLLDHAARTQSGFQVHVASSAEKEALTAHILQEKARWPDATAAEKLIERIRVESATR